MFKVIRNAWAIPDLRKKLLFTLLIIVVFRVGSVIPVPFIDTNALQAAMAPANSVTSDVSNNMIAYLNTLSGGAFSNATIFAMGITPYINSSIIIQLLCVAIPALERLSKEGEAGRKKIGTITRYVTVGLGLIQGTAYFFYLHNSAITSYREGFSMVFAAIVIVLVFTAGTALMMWLGEQINKYGIGNGISILLLSIGSSVWAPASKAVRSRSISHLLFFGYSFSWLSSGSSPLCRTPREGSPFSMQSV